MLSFPIALSYSNVYLSDSEVVWLEDTEQNTSCTLSLSDGGSLDDLYFTLRPINYTISHEYVNIVNDTTLTLTLPRSQVTPEISARSLFCYWKGEVLSRQHISIVGKKICDFIHFYCLSMMIEN